MRRFRMYQDPNHECAAPAAVDADPDQGPEEPTTTKMYRTSKACFQCRARKQKCSGPGGRIGAGAAGSDGEPRQPCRRCAQSAAQCSFTSTDSHSPSDGDVFRRTSDKLGRLQREVNEQAGRIEQLEATVKDLGAAASHVSRATGSSPGVSEASTGKKRRDEAGEPAASGVHKRSKHRLEDALPSRSVRLNAHNASPGPGSAAHQGILQSAVDLGTPLSMLRHLRNDINDLSEEIEALDPIKCGVMTMKQAQDAFDTFFSHCHRWAPVLCPQTQASATSVRQTCPALFISICCIGFRFTNTASPEAHRRYMALISLLDHSLSRLLLRPNLTDVNLDHIRAILLYVQWMPVDNIGSSSRATRYNAISAWSMLGLAIRYALFLGLHQDAASPFSSTSNDNQTLEDVGRLRVWINLLTCDAALTLSSGLPATLNPDPVVAVAERFRSHNCASHPDDTRSSATCELVSILKRATRSSGSPNARSLDAACLRQVNLELDSWSLKWNTVIGDQIQHYQMPFTTLRTYRLSINSACLSPLLRPSGSPRQIPIHVLQALEVSLYTASMTIFALSDQARYRHWNEFSTLGSLPPGNFTPDTEAVNRIRYSVDSTWISFSFATMLLVLCYKGGLVDENLEIVALRYNSAGMVTFPQRQAATSLLFRLVSLAARIFDLASANTLAHPALDQKELLSGVFAVVLGNSAADEDPFEVPAAVPYSDREVEALFDSIADSMDLGWCTN